MHVTCTKIYEAVPYMVAFPRVYANIERNTRFIKQ